MRAIDAYRQLNFTICLSSSLPILHRHFLLLLVRGLPLIPQLRIILSQNQKRPLIPLPYEKLRVLDLAH